MLPISTTKPRVVAIVGQTATGKSDLAVNLALKFNGEVISADSRQVYRGLDLGTGKITKEEMKSIPHHLIDVEDPQNTYSVDTYIRDGKKAMSDIFNKGKLPIIAGGTGFYIDALLENWSLPGVPKDQELRSELEKKTLEELFLILSNLDPERSLTVDKKNKVRLVRSIEIAKKIGRVPVLNKEEEYDVLYIGLILPKDELQKKIKDRIEKRIKDGMIEEVKSLLEKGLNAERMYELGLEYRYISLYLKGELSEIEMIDKLSHEIWLYAKRQITWFKRNKKLIWISPKESRKAEELVREFLTSE